MPAPLQPKPTSGITPIRPLIPAALALVALLSACASPPAPRTAPPQGHAAPPATHGPLANLDARFRASHEGATGGFVLLPRNEDGLRWRIALADAATSSLDLQYYIWWGDPSGDLLMKHVVDAANRGVRVRLILDDISTVLKSKAHPEGQDWDTAMLDTHPNIQVRLFNASHARSLLARGMEFIAHADQLNQRMHNKLMVADNRAMVVGGRNIGDEYFGLSDKLEFPRPRRARRGGDRRTGVNGIRPVLEQPVGYYGGLAARRGDAAGPARAGATRSLRIGGHRCGG